MIYSDLLKSNEILYIGMEVLGVDKTYMIIHGKEELSAEMEEKITKACAEFNSGRPLQYIFNRAYFYGKSLYVDERVLVPRPETEILCELIPEGKGKALDLCTGSGCIASVLLDKGYDVTASDLSKDALAVASINAKGAKFLHSDLFDKLDGSFDIICSNPPYIPRDVIDTLDKNVRDFEPHMALDGGEKGWELPLRIIARAKDYLSPGGLLLMEIGDDQGVVVLDAANRAGFRDAVIVKDYSDQDRILKAWL